MKAVVTGATGFIGSALTAQLARAGVTVYAVGRNPEKLATLARREGVTALVDAPGHAGIPQGVDVFFHCAFEGGFGGTALKNYALQLRNAALACDAAAHAAALGARKFVLASTVNTVELRSFIGSESFKPRYTCIYSAGKLAAELMGKTIAHNTGMPFCTALIAMPYGEGNTAATLPNVVMSHLASGKRPALIEGRNLYDLIYIGDVAGALMAIGAKGRNFRDYYVGHRELQSFKRWIEQMRDVLAPELELVFGEYPDSPSLDYSLLDLDALYRDTGFECTADFETSIRRTAEWL
ncbi:NAD(P)-dependent oxidoreductase, partial [uncultured Mailhella sp.]|uniref:NAD-dependent epimerase/dehydratase family protein n=1 Tax=uncultured Mailhella sp. TaxID=1981031 RepID=UPI002618839A